MNYEIKDMRGFAKSIGKTVAEDLQMDKSELKDYITVKNVVEMATQYCIYDKTNKKFIANEGILDTILEETRDWIIGLSLARLSSEGHLECAWDDERECMIFWRPDNAEEETD
jgi:hypothetical protein